MQCKVRNYQLSPDPKNLGKPLKVDNNMNNIIYDETMYFPIEVQQTICREIEVLIRISTNRDDLEKRMNEIILTWKDRFGLTTYKPLFPKKNLGVLIGDPFYQYY